MSFDVAFILILFIVYLAFLAQAKTYFAEVWLQFVICTSTLIVLLTFIKASVLFCSFAQGSNLLWTHTLRPFINRPIALAQGGRSLINDVCECMRD